MKTQTISVANGSECKIFIEEQNESHWVQGPVNIVVYYEGVTSQEELSMEERFELVARALEGLKHYQWSRIVQKIDMMFSHQAARVEIDDLELLKENLQKEFK